jgi:hypothetical protein
MKYINIYLFNKNDSYKFNLEFLNHLIKKHKIKSLMKKKRKLSIFNIN